jgi:hypothetical protein
MPVTLDPFSTTQAPKAALTIRCTRFVTLTVVNDAVPDDHRRGSAGLTGSRPPRGPNRLLSERKPESPTETPGAKAPAARLDG